MATVEAPSATAANARTLKGFTRPRSPLPNCLNLIAMIVVPAGRPAYLLGQAC